MTLPDTHATTPNRGEPGAQVARALSNRVAVVMGSQSDWSVMTHCAETLAALGVDHEAKIVSAHRTPDRLVEFARSAHESGFAVIIAAAGGAAHLPGMIASMTHLPVLGVPVAATLLNGIDSLLSIVQMPGGIPVGTLAIGKPGAINAALFAGAILGLSDPKIEQAIRDFRSRQTAAVGDAP